MNAAIAPRRSERGRDGTSQGRGTCPPTGGVASADDLPLTRYDEFTAAEVTERLAPLSQVELATVDAYERKHDSRSTILDRLTSLRDDEPWAGYDDMDVESVRPAPTHHKETSRDLATRESGLARLGTVG